MGLSESSLVDTKWERQDNSLLLLPDYIMTRILRTLVPYERKDLRLVCKKLAHDVREFVGVSDCFYPSDTKPYEAMDFYGKNSIRNLEISEPCVLWGFRRLLQSPNFLKEFSLLSRGRINEETAIQVLTNCKNLNSLTWTGSIQLCFQSTDIIELFVQVVKLYQGEDYMESNLPVTVLPKLKNLHIKATIPLRSSYRDLNYHIPSNMFLLKSVTYPVLEEATLVLTTTDNGRPRDIGQSQLELAGNVFHFLYRHSNPSSNLRSVKIYHNEDWYRSFQIHTCQVDSDEDALNYSPWDEVIPEILIAPPPKLTMRDFLFSTNLSSYNYLDTGDKDHFETQILKLVSNMQGLQTLKMSLRNNRPVTWWFAVQALTANFNSLVHLELTSLLLGPIDFNIFARCADLKFIKIDRMDWIKFTVDGDLSPNVVNFGPHPTMIKKLEVLVLTNLGIGQAELPGLKQLKNLKHLVIDYWRNGCGCEGVNFHIIKSVLHLRSLDSVHLLQTHFRHKDPEEQKALEYIMNTLEFNYKHIDKGESTDPFFALANKCECFWTDPFGQPTM